MAVRKKKTDESELLRLFKAARTASDSGERLRLRSRQREAQRMFNNLVILHEEIEKLQRKIGSYKYPDAQEELDKISKLEGVESFRMVNNHLIVRTKTLSAKNIKKRRVTFGQFTITVDVPSARIHTIINDRPVRFDETNWHHMYTEQGGCTCWGNAGDQIARCSATRDISGLLAIVIDFLQVGRTKNPIYQMFLLREKERQEKEAKVEK